MGKSGVGILLPSKRINDHEYDLIKKRRLSLMYMIGFHKGSLPGYERFVREKAFRKDQNSDGN